MGYLSGKSVYLCGAVEAHQSPNSWRNKITPHLQQHGLVVLNPLIKPKWMSSIDAIGQKEMKQILINSRNYFDIEKVKRDNTIIRAYCLSLVRMCDFFIVKLDNVFTVGTFEEITIAKDKPIFIISDVDIPSMWLMAQLNIYNLEDRKFYLHKTMESCLSTLEQINEKIPNNLDPFKWIFLRHNE
jgi:hypothetical protein